MNTKIFRDIRFWIVLFFLIRLYGITNPPLEVGHNWRQTTVTMVARNFLEVDNNIFFPRVDFAGEKSGITGMEFPLLNYLIYLVSLIFGYQHWYGRLINLIISSLGMYYYYKLITKYFGERVAFFATILLAVSLWFSFSRKIMPDTFAMSFVIAGIYYGTNYLDTNRKPYLHLAAYFFLTFTGILSKLPAGYLLILFVLFFADPKISLKRKVVFAGVTLAGLIPVFVWYFYWVPHLVKTYGFWHFFMGESFAKGFREIMNHLPQTLGRFYETAMKYTGFAVFCFGLIYAILRKEKRILLVFFFSFAAFCIIIFKAGYTFYHHNYYIIPFVPVMALVAGYGLSREILSRYAVILLVIVSVEGIADQQHDFRIKEKYERLLQLEPDLDKISGRDALICVNTNYPTPIYFAHRKGWRVSNEELRDPEYMQDLVSKGLRYIIILKRCFGTEVKLDNHRKLLENEDYCIYDAKPSSQ